jgi:hypothetical protein
MAPMAKKKNQSKKHKFKYSEPTSEMSASVTQTPAPVTASNGATATRPQAQAVAASTRDFSYVISDLKRISVLLASLVVFELVLWYLFHHTGVGDSVRSVIKL